MMERSTYKHQPAATITLTEPLYFHAKRLDSLELSDVPVQMRLTRNQMPGGKFLSVEAVAGGFRVGPEQIKPQADGGVEIQHDSINKALASLFANRNDKSPNNNRSAYLHVAWIDGDLYVSIDKIRSDFERGDWHCPEGRDQTQNLQASLLGT